MIQAYWPFALAFLFFAMNFVAFAAFWADKRAAEARAWRIPEETLLTFAGLGGILGAKLAQRLLRHKTRKEPFRTRLNRIAAVQAAIFVVLAFPPSRAAAFALARGLFAP